MPFQIRSTVNGLLSTGGTSPRFTRKGKVWNTRGALTLHLTQLWKSNVYKDCEVVEFEVTVRAISAQPVSITLKEIADRKIAAEQKRHDARKRETEKQERATLAALQKKYPTP